MAVTENLGVVPRARPNLAPWLRALLAQIGAALLALTVATQWPGQVSTWGYVGAQALLAVALAWTMRLPIWWYPLQFLFVPLVVVTLSVQVAPGWFLLAFGACLLTYWTSFKTQVPLYLSSRDAHRALAELLPERPDFRFLELGSGLGGLIAHLVQQRPDGRYTGIEIAPLPWLCSAIRAMGSVSTWDVRWGNFWAEDFARYDVVYAFLSPVPMADLWHKVKKEMRPGTLFISNSFAVPNVEPQQILQLPDRTKLYLWRQ